MIFLTALLPLALALLFLIFRQMQVSLSERETRALCRADLLHAQNDAGRSISRLLNLNPLIRAAKATRDEAEIAMAAAAASYNFPAFAAALKVYETAIQTLDGLRIAQNFYLIDGHTHLVQGLARAQSDLRANWVHQRKSAADLQVLRAWFTGLSIPHLAVRPADRSDPYPEYVLEDDFQEKQALQVSWRMDWQPSPQRPTWNHQNWRFDRGCAATLTAEGSNFKARLKEAKSSSKSFFFF